MQYKHTKIICTISDKRCEPEFIRALVDNGMNVARLNTAHLNLKSAEKIVQAIRQVSRDIGILIDTKGPEVRTVGNGEPITVAAGDAVYIGDGSTAQLPENGFVVNYDDFVADVPVGSQVLIDDGVLEMEVVAKNSGSLVCTVKNDGVIQERKSVNIPEVYLNLPSLTEKDVEFIDWASRNEIDFIAHSFVRNRDDVMAIQSILSMRKCPAKIIAKIENREGVNNLDAILDVAHSIMIARGDLGIEIPAEEVPFIQKEMIKTCIRRVKPVITATQMLHSMIDNPRPTRAEVSDVANAVYDGTDALMLSGETAYGKFPIEAVKAMADIAHNVEGHNNSRNRELPVIKQETQLMPRNHLAKAAVSIAASLEAKAIVTSTRSGDTAQICSSYRGTTTIFAVSESERTVRELSLCYGVFPAKIDIPSTTDELVYIALDRLITERRVTPDELVVFIGGGHIFSAQTNFLQVDTPRVLMKRTADSSSLR